MTKEGANHAWIISDDQRSPRDCVVARLIPQAPFACEGRCKKGLHTVRVGTMTRVAAAVLSVACWRQQGSHAPAKEINNSLLQAGLCELTCPHPFCLFLQLWIWRVEDCHKEPDTLRVRGSE